MTQCICGRRDIDVLQIKYSKLLTHNLFVIITMRQKVEKYLEQMLFELKSRKVEKTLIDASKKMRNKYCAMEIKGDFFRLTGAFNLLVFVT